MCCNRSDDLLVKVEVSGGGGVGSRPRGSLAAAADVFGLHETHTTNSQLERSRTIQLQPARTHPKTVKHTVFPHPLILLPASLCFGCFGGC